MELYRAKIENIIKKSLPFFFVLVFLTTITGSWLGYLEHNSWKMGDWLINYQGGMIRRGLLGEIIFQLAHFTHINPGIYVVIFQIFFYAVFFLISYFLLKKQHALLPFALLIFSPFIFCFQINDLQGGYRKEIIYFALLALIVWSTTIKESKKFEKIFFTILFFYPLVILTHEMLAIFLPYLLAAFILSAKLNKKKNILICVLLLPSIIVFFVASHFSGTEIQVSTIFTSIANENYKVSGGSISWLSKDAAYATSKVSEAITIRHFNHYIFVTPLALIAYIPVYYDLKRLFKNKPVLWLLNASIFGTIGLMLYAMDWGRFLYIHLVSIFLLLLLPAIQIHNIRQKPPNVIKKSTVVLFIVYILFWHIPHAGYFGKTYEKRYKTVNYISFLEPYKKIIKLYNKKNKKNISIINRDNICLLI